MSKFKVGDRVEWVGGHAYKDPEWQFMKGARATVYQVGSGLRVHWDDHEDNEPREGRITQWYAGAWENEDFKLAAPLSPFEAEVQAYIRSELNVQV